VGPFVVYILKIQIYIFIHNAHKRHRKLKLCSHFIQSEI
jgi:hypothetical protein